MGAVKAVGNLVGKTVNKGIRTVTGNPKTPSVPTARMAAAPAPASVPASVPASAPVLSSVPSTNSFGGMLSASDNSTDSRRSSSGSLGLGDIPDTKIALTEPETDEDDSITVKSPGIEADDEEKRRDAVDKANEYMMSSESY